MTISIPFSRIKKTTASMAGVSIEDMEGDSRLRDVAYARQVAAWLGRKYTGLSFPDLGARLGGRHHSTVIYGCNCVAADIAYKRPRGLLALDVEAVLLGDVQ
jgi:chromosomal replication initiator protein